MIGQVVAHYRILEQLDKGGMGVVYVAEDTRLGRRVAVKFSQAEAGDTEFRQRFLREARLASSLNHPNIATIYDYGETEDGHPFIVMELVKGRSLHHHLQANDLTLPQKLKVISDVAGALSEAHQHGIIHRDIKPQNVILNERGAVKVLDFGLAKQFKSPAAGEVDLYAPTLEQQPTRAGMVLGTPHYMSPEQARGTPNDADPRSDLFSLGVVLYQCLAGWLPFTGKTAMEVCAQVLHVNPPPPSQFQPQVSGELDQITLKAIAKEPGERYQTVDELMTDLRAAHLTLSAPARAQVEPTTSNAVTAAMQMIKQSGISIEAKVFSSFAHKIFPANWSARVTFWFFGIVLALLCFAGWLIARQVLPSPYAPLPEARQFYDAGVAALRNGAFYQARTALRRTLELDENFALAQARLAEAWLEMEYADKANQALLRANALASEQTKLPEPAALYLQALNHTAARQFAEAVVKYRKLVEQTPEAERAFALVSLGRAYEKNEEVEQAIQSYMEAKRLNSQYGAAALRLGVLYGRQRNLNKALTELALAEKIYGDLSNLEGITEVQYQRGVLFNQFDRPTEAAPLLQQVRDAGEKAQNHYHRIAALLQLSLTSFLTGQTEQSRRLAEQATRSAHEYGLDNLSTQGLIDLGNTLFQRRQYKEAESQFNQALALAHEAKVRRSEALARLSLGKLFLQQYIKTEEAIQHLEQSLAFFQQGGYYTETSEATSLLGRAKLQGGDYAAALRIFDEQLARAKQYNAPSFLAKLHSLIGRTLAEQEAYPQALLHFEESYAIYQPLNKPLYLGYALLDRSEMLWRLGRAEEARNWLIQLPALAEQIDNQYRQILLARMHLTSAKLLLSEQRAAEAVAEAQQTLSLADTPTQYTAIEAKYTLALAAAFSNKPRQAKQLCEEAITAAVSLDYQGQLWNARLALAEVQLASGAASESRQQAEQAFEHFLQAGQPESQWLAACLAAQASRQMNDLVAARERAASANSLLAALQQKWGEAAYKGYLSRRDIQHRSEQSNESAKAVP